jgi:NCAIR mutase (PurE)-related protein
MDPKPINIDLDRQRRCGYPEVVFGPGKTIQQLCEIVRLLLHHGQPVLATRIDALQAAGLVEAFPGGRYNAVARTFRIEPSPSPTRHGSSQASLKGRGISQANVTIISAGTGDLPVAEEARETLEWMGVRVTMIHDVGVAGPHRLAARLDEFQNRGSRRYGRRAAERRGRLRLLPGDRCADKRRLRGELRRRVGAALDA